MQSVITSRLGAPFRPERSARSCKVVATLTDADLGDCTCLQPSHKIFGSCGSSCGHYSKAFRQACPITSGHQTCQRQSQARAQASFGETSQPGLQQSSHTHHDSPDYESPHHESPPPANMWQVILSFIYLPFSLSSILFAWGEFAQCSLQYQHDQGFPAQISLT